MSPRLSSLIANATLLVAIPLGLLAAYAGFRAGLYPYSAVPFVGVGLVLVLLVGLIVVLPPLRRLEGGE